MTALSENAYATAGRDENGRYIGCKSHVFELLTAEDMPSDGPVGVPETSGDSLISVKDSGSTESYIPLVVIVIGFPNLQYNYDFDWSQTIFEDDWGLRNYYKDMSFGKFTFEPAEETSAYGGDNKNKADSKNDGIIHVTLDLEKQYGWNVDENGDVEMANGFHDAIIEAAKYMDFSAYDSDGDGSISNSELAVAFAVAGLDYTGDRNSEKYMYTWPNAWKLSGIKSRYSKRDIKGPAEADGVKVDSYIAFAEQYEKQGSLKYSGINALTHELGHYLGLTDLYNTDRYTGKWPYYDVNYLSLMAKGDFGTDRNGEDRPFSIDIFSRVKLGWVEPEVSAAGCDSAGTWKISGSHKEPAANDEIIALKIETSTDGEYYLVENRRFTKWDEGMGSFYNEAAKENGEDYGGGFIFWHIDEILYNEHIKSNTVNVPYNRHCAVMPLFIEYDKDDNPTMIGTIPSKDPQPFFSAKTMDGRFDLPIYGISQDSRDTPADRKYTLELLLRTQSESAPVMELHRHGIAETRVDVDDTAASAYIRCSSKDCYDADQDIFIERTNDVVKNVIQEPTMTERGITQYTCNFSTLELEGYTTEVYPPALDEKAELKNASLDAITPVTYNGKAQTPDVTVTLDGKKLKKDSDYTLTYSNNTNAGTASVTVCGIGDYRGTLIGSFTIKKAANTLSVNAKTASVKYKKLKKKNQKLDVSKVISFNNPGQGTLSYTKVKGSKKISVNKASGKVTVKKGLKKGSYKIKVNVAAAGNSNCEPSEAKTLTIKIKVK